MGIQLAHSLRVTLESIAERNAVAARVLSDDQSKTDFGNYLAHRGEFLSFLPAGKPHIVNNGRWSREGRQEGRPSRIIRKFIITEGLTDKAFEDFANEIKARGLDEEEQEEGFELVSGEAIRRWYHEDTYAYGQGSLAHSCMKHGYCQDFFDIYVYNPDKIQMLIMKNDDDQLIGRAIVWTLDDGGIFKDRTYGKDATIQRFTNYAKDKGWMAYEDRPEWERLTVTLENAMHTFYPYMDSLSNLKELDAGRGRLMGHSRDRYDWSLSDTDGGPINGGLSSCEYCDDSYHEDDLYDGYCRYCYENNREVSCWDCDREFVISEMETHPDYDHRFICDDCLAERELVECTMCGVTEHPDNMFENPLDELYVRLVCEPCYDSLGQCSECEGWEKREQLHDRDGDLFCDECMDKIDARENELAEELLAA